MLTDPPSQHRVAESKSSSIPTWGVLTGVQQGEAEEPRNGKNVKEVQSETQLENTSRSTG